MKKKTAEELSKLQIICSLFSDTTSGDLYFAQQIKESIEASLSEDQLQDPHDFLSCAKKLVAKIENENAPTAFELLKAKDDSNPFSLLDLRTNLLGALKKICPFDTGLVVLTGLKEAICPKGKRWSKLRKQEYEEAISFTRAFCVSRTRPTSTLSLIIF